MDLVLSPYVPPEVVAYGSLMILTGDPIVCPSGAEAVKLTGSGDDLGETIPLQQYQCGTFIPG